MSQGAFPGVGPAASGVAGTTQPCRACGAQLPKGSLFCDWCKAPQAGAPRCPHCRTPTGVSPHPELRFTCNVCGAPRVPLEAQGVTLSGAEDASLREANELRTGRALWRLGAGFAGAGIAAAWLFASLWMILFGWSTLFTVLAAVVSVPLFALLFAGLSKARARTRKISAAIDAGWRAAAAHVVQQLNGPVTAKQLAQLMPMTEEEAERLLTELSLDDAVRTEVLDDGNLAYLPSHALLSPAAPPEPRLRIDTGAMAASGASPTVKKALKQTMVAGLAAPAHAPRQSASASDAATAEAAAEAEEAASTALDQQAERER